MDNTLDLFYFKRPLDTYGRTLDPVNEYVKQASLYLHNRTKKPIEECRKEVINILKNKKDIRNPEVRYHQRQKNGDIIEVRDKITNYLKDILDNDELMAPSLTSYANPTVLKSIHAQFLKHNVKERSVYKKEAFKAKQNGNKEKYEFYNTLQKTKKVFNNSLSGAYASKSTILYNPSNHSTLTSITRCVASIGNSISESIISGNKHFRKPELVYNYITAILEDINLIDVEILVNEYNLYKPSTSDVINMIKRSTKWYWDSETIFKDLEDYINSLSDIERVAILYVNDLYHFRVHNEKLVRDMLTEMKQSKIGLSDDLRYLTESAEGIDIMSKIINGELIKGMNIVYSELQGTEILDRLISTAYHITKVLDKYKPIFRTLFTTNVLPISIAYIKDMMRQCIVLSDTDSTCGSYGEWVEWYYGEQRFDQEAVNLATCVMTINTQLMDHNIKVFSKNMNIPNSDIELLKMKNEFYWSVFTPSNVSKHYFASTCIQEGNVFKEPDLELKGAHLIASAVDQEIVSKVHWLIKDINAKLSNNETISIVHYIKEVANLERLAIDKILKGDSSIFSKTTIKEANSYKGDIKDSVYWNHNMWNEVFADKYGNSGEPPYMIVKIPLTINTETKLKQFIENIEDESIKVKFEASLKKYGKKMFSTFRPPLQIIDSKGIPKEFLSIININRVVKDNLKSAYIMLESIGYYTHPDRLISESGY